VAGVLGTAAVLLGSYFEVRSLDDPLTLLLASYTFVGAWILSIAWLASLRETDGTSDAPTWEARLRRLLLPLPTAVVQRMELAVLAGCGLLALYLLAHLLLFQYGRDQGVYAVVARTIVEGGVPYRDAWDLKPPGIFFLYAGARLLFGPAQHGIRILEVLGMLSLIPAFAILSRRFVGSARSALVAAALGTMACVQLEFWNTAQPESFASVALAWALVAATGPAASQGGSVNLRQEMTWLLVGALYGAAGVLKPQLAGGVILTPWLIGLARARSRGTSAATPRQVLRAGLAPLGVVALGASLPIVAVVIYFSSHGALKWMIDTLFNYVPQHTKLGLAHQSLPASLGQGLRESVVAYSRHNGFGLVLLAALPVLAPREREGVAHVIAVVFFPIVGIGLQAKFFPYHYATVLPFLSLLAAWGCWKIWIRARHALVPALLTLAAVYWLKDPRAIQPYRASLWDRNWVRLMLVFGPEENRAELQDLLHDAGDVRAGDNRRAAAWIAEHTQAASPVFVWGFEPVIYDLAGRPAATRYIYNVPQRVPWALKHRGILLDDLRRQVPEVVVVEHGDVFPLVTGDKLDSAHALSTFPELARFLSVPYAPGPRFGKLDLLVRRSTEPSPIPASDAAQTPARGE
jgi:hypothetical protein